MVCLGKNFGNQFRLFKPIERIKNCWTCSTNSWFRYISFHAHAMFPTPWCTDHLTSYDMCLNVCLYAMYVCYVHTVIVAGLSRLCSLLVAGSDEEVGRVSRFMDLDGSSWSFCHKMQIKIYHISRFKKCNMYTFEVVRLSRGAKSCELLQGRLNETRLSFEDKKKRRLRFEGHGISTSKGWLRALFENRVPKIWCLTIIFPNHIKYNIYIYIFLPFDGYPPFSDTWRLIDLGTLKMPLWSCVSSRWSWSKVSKSVVPWRMLTDADHWSSSSGQFPRLCAVKLPWCNAI